MRIFWPHFHYLLIEVKPRVCCAVQTHHAYDFAELAISTKTRFGPCRAIVSADSDDMKVDGRVIVNGDGQVRAMFAVDLLMTERVPDDDSDNRDVMNG